jgi:hypothetical protein
MNFSQNWGLKNDGGLVEGREEEGRREREKERDREDSAVQHSRGLEWRGRTWIRCLCVLPLQRGGEVF